MAEIECRILLFVNGQYFICWISIHLGFVTQYFLINMCYFWLFHVCSTFCKVMFPSLAKRTEEKEGIFHVLLVILGQYIKRKQLNVTFNNYQISIIRSFSLKDSNGIPWTSCNLGCIALRAVVQHFHVDWALENRRCLHEICAKV